MVKINFGCGVEQQLPGWINVDSDFHAAPDVVADLSRGMPFPSASVDFIFSEALLEQLNLGQSEIFLRECRRVLKPTGVMRLLAADLEKLAQTYLNNPDWLVETWEITTGVPLKTRKACEVLNLGIRVGKFFFTAKPFNIWHGKVDFVSRRSSTARATLPNYGISISAAPREASTCISSAFPCEARA